MVEDGHEVYVTCGYDHPPYNYMESLGVNILDKDVSQRESFFLKWLEENNPDIIISTSPRNNFRKNAIPCIGLDERSSKLETHKLWMHGEISKLGIKTPEILDAPEFPCVIKPSILVKGGNGDFAQICYNQYHFDILNKKHDYYIEKFIPDNIETNVAYAMSRGKWSIMHTQRVYGEDEAKIAGAFCHWTQKTSFGTLTKEQEEITLQNATKILDWMSSYTQSDFVGQITGLIKDSEWYFCENNVRPEQSNSLPYFVSGNQWLEAMQGKPEILGDAFPKDVAKMIVIPKEPDSIYPFHLHQKHNVAIPCGLDIIDGEYRVAKTFRTRSRDDRIGIVICDRDIPEEFIDDIEEDGNFFISDILLPKKSA